MGPSGGGKTTLCNLVPRFFDVTNGRILIDGVDVRDIAAAATWAAKAGPVAVLGYCWGGTLALLSCTRLKLPAVSYYGGRSVPFLHERPGAPLLMHFGERDSIIPPAHLALTRAALPQAEIHVWPAGHGFNCEERADYDPACALQAQAVTLAFLQRQAA